MQMRGVLFGWRACAWVSSSLYSLSLSAPAGHPPAPPTPPSSLSSFPFVFAPDQTHEQRTHARTHPRSLHTCARPPPIAQASQEVSKAGALDYVATPEERMQHALERPLDRYLMPLATSLALRTSLTQVCCWPPACPCAYHLHRCAACCQPGPAQVIYVGVLRRLR